MKKSYIIGIVIIAVALAAILSSVADSGTYASFSVAEANPESEYHVVGTLNKEKPTEYNPHINANLFSFYLIDNKGMERKVSFNGTKPQDFERSEQVVVIGKMGNDGFQASSILMKCPSKYNNSQELKEIKAGA
jgi:cytochrome c-type biogenesis protein CcmE